MKKPHTGDRFAVQQPFEAIVAVHWHAPFASGCRRILPIGLELILLIEPPAEATAVAA